MGIGFEVNCKKCKYQEKFLLGKGISIQSAIERLQEGKRNIILQKLEGKRVKGEHDSYQLFRCETCDDISTELYIEVMTTDEEIITTKHICSTCQKEKVVIEPIFHELPCPKCHKKRLEIESIIKWDYR